jgi:hypothetical protein
MQSLAVHRWVLKSEETPVFTEILRISVVHGDTVRAASETAAWNRLCQALIALPKLDAIVLNIYKSNAPLRIDRETTRPRRRLIAWLLRKRMPYLRWGGTPGNRQV